ncbi:MAG: agmatinase [Alicyclobacillaceae bacterium]|nr:agmatinase [Alicyclobacillaceae bacterium]
MKPVRFDPAFSGEVFIGAAANYSEASAVIYGMPMDWTVSFRPGARLGPRRIREASAGLEEYSPYLDRHLGEIRFYDAGDIPLPFGNPVRSLERIREVAGRILDDGKIPIGLGGEHLVTWGPVRAAAERYPDLAVLHLDAHADLREEYEGEEYSHASVMRRIVELLGGDRVWQFGIRSGTREEFRFARATTRFYPFEVLPGLGEAVEALRGRPVYVTVDIDVVDPAFAPGTGTAEPGGISSAELFRAVHQLRGLRVVGFDLVEVAPNLDPTEQTSILAAKVIREVLLTVVPDREGGG